MALFSFFTSHWARSNKAHSLREKITGLPKVKGRSVGGLWRGTARNGAGRSKFKLTHVARRSYTSGEQVVGKTDRKQRPALALSNGATLADATLSSNNCRQDNGIQRAVRSSMEGSAFYEVTWREMQWGIYTRLSLSLSLKANERMNLYCVLWLTLLFSIYYMYNTMCKVSDVIKKYDFEDVYNRN